MKNLLLVMTLLCVSTYTLFAQQGLAEAIANKISQNFVVDASYLPLSTDTLSYVYDALKKSVIDSTIFILEKQGFEVQKGFLEDVYAHNCAFHRTRTNILSLSRDGIALYAAIIEIEENLYQETYYVDVRYCEYQLIGRF